MRHLQKFRNIYPHAPFPSDKFIPPSKTALSLVFFAAYLFELDSIKSYKTIRNYITHVRQFYVKKGYPRKKLHSPLLKAVMQGIKRCMPPKADSRIAFLLIHYHIPRHIRQSKAVLVKKVTATMSFGFFAMLRFHTYGKLCKNNLTLVLRGGKEVSPTNFNNQVMVSLLTSNAIVGFYFTFDDKFHPGARAYFCKIGDINNRLKAICPLKHLITIMQSIPDEMFFHSSVISSKVLIKYMKRVACIEKNVKPHSLRIGGHTFYTVYGLDADFRDYLARRKVHKSTQT